VKINNHHRLFGWEKENYVYMLRMVSVFWEKKYVMHFTCSYTDAILIGYFGAWARVKISQFGRTQLMQMFSKKLLCSVLYLVLCDCIVVFWIYYINWVLCRLSHPDFRRLVSWAIQPQYDKKYESIKREAWL